jgi:NADP-dependent 3-hydroxy acid dehydrogenase YdfG
LQEPEFVNSEMLRNKNAIIYGAAGSLGSTIAKAISRSGANVFLAGRHLPSVKAVADEIVDSGERDQRSG